ncbi:hypothetical protein ACWOFR_05250 [Carnobacterium gallinarum]|uniref:hypothetical protein n=1 Tax=Carnobacterium gallinarum TaxID=2749 RepID=UPI00055743EA|nr:hypothetical protein [Carnobacterium gallinarum]
MSSIDKYWNDRLIYHIGFVAKIMKMDGAIENKEFHRTFIFPDNLSTNEISDLIFLRLDNIIEITYIEEFVEALELRNDDIIKSLMLSK